MQALLICLTPSYFILNV